MDDKYNIYNLKIKFFFIFILSFMNRFQKLVKKIEI